MPENHYDVILVGGGIANVMSAIRLANTGKSVLLLERGNTISKRGCPKNKLGKCAGCNPCQITTGFGGAGFFSDCKLTYSDEVGGAVADYIGKETFDANMQKVSDIFTRFGAREEYVYNEDFANKLQYDCSRYGMRLVKYPVRHLGTDGAYEVMVKIYEFLSKAENITIRCRTEVKDIRFESKTVILTTGEELTADNISIAVGRHGSEWLSNMCKSQGIKINTGYVDIGVRVECPRAVTDAITDNLYEMKILYHSSSGNTCRTFCVNPGGLVVEEKYDGDISCVNGHSLSDNKSLTTNFAILVSCHFTEPFNEPIEYGKRICRLSNMLSDGKPMVQRLVDLQSYKRTTRDRLRRVIYEPTLKGAEPGDLRYVFPSNILDSILEFLEKLDNVMPGINSVGNSTLLYSPECKFSSSIIELNHELQTEKFPGIYFAGDSAGISRGIMQASIAGYFIAENILGK